MGNNYKFCELVQWTYCALWCNLIFNDIPKALDKCNGKQVLYKWGWKIVLLDFTEIYQFFLRLNFFHCEKPVCLHLVINIRVHYLIKILLRLPKVSESCGMTGIIKIFFFKWWNQLWTKDVFHSDNVFCYDPL